MAREINSRTGNYHDQQDADLHQSLEDRLHTPLGGRLLWTNYGFPSAWTQLGPTELRQALETAIFQDALSDTIAFRTDAADLIVDVQTFARDDY